MARPKGSKNKAKLVSCDDCGSGYLSAKATTCMDGGLRCPSCRKVYYKAAFEKKFGVTASAKYGSQEKYKYKAREWRLKKYYGITQSDYEAMLAAQNFTCAICKNPPPDGEVLVVDHDHATGKVRGLLCQIDNRAIGHFRDDIKRLHYAVGYLKRSSPRQSWDGYFTEIASLVATRSKDRSSQVGAVLVAEKVILSTGYNGFPRGVNDDKPERHERPEKYRWTVHAEENAILNAVRVGTKVDGSTLYVTPFSPCTECAKAIVSSGIREVVVDKVIDNPRWQEDFAKAQEIFEACGVLVRPPQ